MAIGRELERVLGQATEVIIRDLQKEIREQGHVNTGRGLRSLRYEIIQESDGTFTSNVYWIEYMSVLNDGVKKDRIPFTPGRRTGAGNSKYIQGLIDYFRSRGLPEREAKGAAFATATVQSREGLPTRASRRFSRNGQRTGMTARVETERGAAILNFMATRSQNIITIDFRETAEDILSSE